MIGPDTSVVPVDMSKGWCAGHGVPESVCTQCNSSLVAKFKEGQDWCAEHGLPESQCTNCNPSAREQWAALDPANATNPTRVGDAPTRENAKPALGPASSPVKPTLNEGWCGGHGVPESVCTRCGASPAKFKEAGDWCEEHDLPESQCVVCHPEVEAEWAKLNPANQKDNLSSDASNTRSEKELKALPRRGSSVRGLIWLEPNHRLLTGSNDSQCQVDRLQVRFLDATTARKAGIETEIVQTRRLSNTIECLAEVGFDQTRLVRITPRVPGVVTEASVEIGSFVKADDVLAVLESPTLGQAKSRYIRVRESHLLAAADFKRVNTIYRGTQRMLEVCTASAASDEVRRELIEVRVGDAKSRLLQAHAALELARSTLAREQTLLDKKISSEQSFEQAKSNSASAEAGFHATREAVAFDNERDRLAAMRTLKVAKSELDAVARELQILGLSDSQLAVLGSESGAALSRYELRSPAAGRIVQRRAVVGEFVEQRDALYTVTDLSTMWLMMDLRERDLALVRVGLPVLFTVDGLPGHAFDGIVSWISNTVDDRTRTVKVRANVPNERGLLRANMFGLARIIVHDNDEVVSIPSEAVQTDGCCQLVFVKQDETLFEPRKVSLGASADGYVEILAGLASGESVVTVGSFLMKTEILKSNIGAGCCDVKLGS
ncbi:MAG: efflux RND transporter periplasmic adaptor subunit [Gammaproteobacteria bacterium]|nr:efflux RND transporter periplasmic adaptor subunit [Gammaproteobacteria bacterium]